MTDELHPNARTVIEAARQRGVELEVTEFPAGTRTAAEAAAAIGVTVGQIVKSLVFAVDGEIVVALVAGDNRVDEELLAKAASGSRTTRADADAVRAATGFPIGGVPPIGHATDLPTYFDPDLLGYDVVWAAAGTPRHSFPITPSVLLDLSRATVAPLAVPRP